VRLPSVLAAVPVALAAALVGIGSSPAAANAPGVTGDVTKSYIVHTDDADLYLEVVHPTDAAGNIIPAPVILTYTPYAVLGRNSGASHWVLDKGYTRATADVIGTGNSGGCYDYGGGGEKRTAHDLVEWIADQSWSAGKIGMLGTSYDGTTQYAAAVTHPRGLVTIVPQAAIDRWYDYAYSGGIRYTDTNEDFGNEGPGAASDEGVDTPLGFDFGFAIPPPVDNDDPNWQERVASTIQPCDELKHTTEAYSDTPTYGGFWQERDYLDGNPGDAHDDIHDVTIPVLVASNWGDWNVKQVDGWQIINGLTNSPDSRAIFGGRWHGHGTPQNVANNFSYTATVDAWMDHWLMGVDNGVPQSLPRVTTRSADETAELPYTAAPDTQSLKLTLSNNSTDGFALTPNGGPTAGGPTASYLWTLSNTESMAGMHPFAPGPGYIGFTSPTLQHDLRVYGEPVLHYWSTIQGQWVTTAVSLLDYDPANYAGSGPSTTAKAKNAVVAFTRGWLDSRYRAGLDHVKLVTAGTSFNEDLAFKPTDYTIRAGHRVVLLMSTETLEWAKSKLPDTPANNTVTLNYQDGKSWLELPASVESGDPFNGNAQLPETPLTVLLPIAALVATGAGLAVRRRRVSHP
jgi:X-Pro dipeptidyl-peptidase